MSPERFLLVTLKKDTGSILANSVITQALCRLVDMLGGEKAPSVGVVIEKLNSNILSSERGATSPVQTVRSMFPCMVVLTGQLVSLNHVATLG